MRTETILHFFKAWVIGAATYFFAAVLTVMDGMLSFIMQPIMAAVVSAIAVVACMVAGLVLRIPFLQKVWTGTKWLPELIAGIGIALLVFSAFPGQMTLHTRVVDDEFEDSWKTLGDTCFPGYFALLFAVANWPQRMRSRDNFLVQSGLIGFVSISAFFVQDAEAEPPIKDEFRTRWMTWQERRELQNAENEAKPNEPANPDPDQPTSHFEELTRQLDSNAGKYADPLVFVGNFDDDLLKDEIVEVRYMLHKYLKRLREESKNETKQSRLALHGLGFTDDFQEHWPDWCAQRREEPNVPEIKGSVTRKGKCDLFTSPNKILARDGLDSLHIYDLATRKWTKAPTPKNEDDVGLRVGISDNHFFDSRHSFSFKSNSWTASYDSPTGDVYLDNPVVAGNEWMSAYRNPPHMHLEQAEDESLPKLSEAKKRELLESFKDRLEFRDAQGNGRKVNVEGLAECFVMESGAIGLVISSTERYRSYDYRTVRREGTLQIATDSRNREFKDVMKGGFNGTWFTWYASDKTDKMVLDQRIDYVGSIPFRAAIWTPDTKTWELLWNTPSPQVEPPPAGVLKDVLAQKPRWNLPRELTHQPIGALVNCSRVISKNDSAFLLSESRDYVTGTFAIHLWEFKPGKADPKKFAVNLPGFSPAKKIPDYLDGDLRFEPFSRGFVIADHRFVWMVEWNE
ncbi:MAG: hypothetical protein RL088_816 [Verrucomicrobiota bacterium]